MTQVKTEKIAQGMLFDGRQFEISKATHDRELRGVGNETFVVDVHSLPRLPGGAYGFSSEQDARRFVTTLGKVTVTGHDTNGDEVEETRDGLGVPEGMIANVNRDE
ncbi:MAG: hypothetical protein ACR2OE_12785 [Thermomicrobiales bacterium]